MASTIGKLLRNLKFILILLSAFPVKKINSENYAVRIESAGRSSACSGTILIPSVILTAAHCFPDQPADSKPVVIVVSKHQEHQKSKKYKIDQVIIHPDYDNTTLENDLAIVKIKEEIDVNDTTMLPDFESGNFIDDYENCFMVGWSVQDFEKFLQYGYLSKIKRKNLRLVESNVQKIMTKECREMMKSFGVLIKEEKICSDEEASSNACFIGTGGPLFCFPKMEAKEEVHENVPSQPEISSQEYLYHEYLKKVNPLDSPIDLLQRVKRDELSPKEVQVGVVSWGKGCSKLPSLYTRTDIHVPWIESAVKKVSNKTFKKYKRNQASSASPKAFSSTVVTISITMLIQYSL